MAVNPAKVLFMKYSYPKLGSTPTVICPAPYYTIIDSIAFLNLTQQIINITTYVLSSTSVRVDRIYTQIAPKQDVELLVDGKTLGLNYGDSLYAYSDYSANAFNSFVICRQLLEQGA